MEPVFQASIAPASLSRRPAEKCDTSGAGFASSPATRVVAIGGNATGDGGSTPQLPDDDAVGDGKQRRGPSALGATTELWCVLLAVLIALWGFAIVDATTRPPRVEPSLVAGRPVLADRSTATTAFVRGVWDHQAQLRVQIAAAAGAQDALDPEATASDKELKVAVARRRATQDEVASGRGKGTAAIAAELYRGVAAVLDAAKSDIAATAEKCRTALSKIVVATRPPSVGGQFVVDGVAVGPNGPVSGAAFEPEEPSEPVEEIPRSPYVPPPDEWASLKPEERNTRRREAVVDAFLHSWKGYEKFAWGSDELQPRTKTAKNWNEASAQGMGLTILDSLSTLFVMGLTKELDKALDWVKKELTFNIDVDASAFESTIRAVGALLSIYELTGEKDAQLLKVAVDIADRILFAYNTSSGLPHATVNLQSHRHSTPQWSGGSAVLSEFGTAQLEFRTLSFHTKNPVYDMKVTHVMSVVESRCPADMLCPVYLSTSRLSWVTDHVTLGALGDSFYEYLLKQYLLTGRTEERYKRMYLGASHSIVEKLLFRSQPSNWAYVAEYKRGEYYHKMDHLACFVGGMIALGAQEVDTASRKSHLMSVAADLTETCVRMYTRQKSGVSPEFVEFPAGNDFINGAGYYILRPETMESLFYMWRFTKEQKWRDYGWAIFAAINRWCRIDSGGFSGLREVNVKRPVRDNLMQSFWMAETLKYTYLLFADDSALDLSQWVFNTEAHPLRIRERDPTDIWVEYENHNEGRVAWWPPTIPGVHSVETPRMSRLRREAEARGEPVVRKAPPDPFGDEAGDADTAVDDDGSPFEPETGMRGLPRDVGGRRDSSSWLKDSARSGGGKTTRKKPPPRVLTPHDRTRRGDGGGGKPTEDSAEKEIAAALATKAEREAALRRQIEMRRQEQASERATDDA